MDVSRGRPSFELVSFPHPVNPPGRAYDWIPSVNDDLHLIHAYRGAGATRMEGRIHPMRPGDVIFIEPHVEYAVRSDAKLGLEMYNFHFHLRLEGGLPFQRARTLPPRFRPRGAERILRELARWHRAWMGGSPWKRARIVAQLHALAVRYLEEFGRAPRLRPADAEMAALGERLQAAQRFDATALAAGCFLSVSQMNRRFRAAYGASPKGYWQKQLHLAARARLLGGNESVGALARALGFEDENYFSRWFKQREGLSPRACRQRAGPLGRI